LATCDKANKLNILALKENFMKKCNEIMTKDPVCCLPNDLVTKAAELMKSEHIGSIPVIENEQTKKLVGIVTDRDLALRIVAEGLDAKSTKVETVMTRKVVTCGTDDDLQKAVDAMSENQLRRIPIVDDDNKILGIIAQADVAMHFDHPKKTAAMIKEISQANAK
jgi:CBS domain-containing protein